MRPLVLTLWLLALALTGCYGSTKPATKIALDHATLNGYGTSGPNGTEVFFQYWQTAYPSHVDRTYPGGQIPASTTGPYSVVNSPFQNGLVAATTYAFRLCGQDTGASQPTCADTRTFKTVTPSGDAVAGFQESFSGIGSPGPYIRADAHSDRTGAHPGGTLDLNVSPSFTNPDAFFGTVTCLAVSGHQAVIGAVGKSRDGQAETGVLKVVDSGANPDGPADQENYLIRPGTAPPDCAAPGITRLFAGSNSDFTVYDTP